MGRPGVGGLRSARAGTQYNDLGMIGGPVPMPPQAPPIMGGPVGPGGPTWIENPQRPTPPMNFPDMPYGGPGDWIPQPMPTEPNMPPGELTTPTPWKGFKKPQPTTPPDDFGVGGPYIPPQPGPFTPPPRPPLPAKPPQMTRDPGYLPPGWEAPGFTGTPKKAVQPKTQPSEPPPDKGTNRSSGF